LAAGHATGQAFRGRHLVNQVQVGKPDCQGAFLFGRVHAGDVAWFYQKAAKHTQTRLGLGQRKTQNFEKEVTWQKRI
jgi:hypothetical protein